MILEMERECLRFDRYVFSFVYHGSVQRNNDMEGKIVIGVLINGRITMDCLCFTYTLVFTV